MAGHVEEACTTRGVGEYFISGVEHVNPGFSLVVHGPWCAGCAALSYGGWSVDGSLLLYLIQR